MDNRREKILVSLGVFMIINHIIVLVMAVQKIVIYQHHVAIMMMIFYLEKITKWCGNSVN